MTVQYLCINCSGIKFEFSNWKASNKANYRIAVFHSQEITRLADMLMPEALVRNLNM